MFISVGTSGGVIYSADHTNDMDLLSSTQCIFRGNSAGGAGGIFRLVGPHHFSSENNEFARNIASTGSVMAADSTFVYMVISGDRIWNNIANAGTINGGELGNVYISNTEFMNNTSEGPTVYVTNSVKSFIILGCIFNYNVAEVEGVIGISYAEQVVLNSLEVYNNNVSLHSMIMIKKSMNTTVLSSFFQDNLCSNLPCALSVQKSEKVTIENFLLETDISVTYTISQSKDNPGAVDTVRKIYIDLSSTKFECKNKASNLGWNEK